MPNLLKKALLFSPVIAAIGCGGSTTQPTGYGSTPDAMLASGSLGTGTPRGSVAKKQPDLGPEATLNGFRPFGDASAWNKAIDHSAVDPASEKVIAKIGADKTLSPTFGVDEKGTPMGIPFVVVAGDAPRMQIDFSVKDQSDAGPYPLPLESPIEVGGDGHAIAIDRDGMKLYEASHVVRDGTGFKAGAGAIWDLRDDKPRKSGSLSADPSGLPVFPGLVRYDEVTEQKEIQHALRFTVATVGKGFVAPATRSEGTDTDPALPQMGMRFRLKKSFDGSKFPASAQVIISALKKYGMILSDTGPDWGLSGTADSKWKEAELVTLKKIKGSDFELVKPFPVKKSKTDDSAKAAAASLAAAANSARG